MSDTTKNLVKCLSTLAENNFTIVSVDWETGQIIVFPENFSVISPKEKELDIKFNLTAAERALAAKGNKIEAIKALRERTNMGLAEAKTAVEAFLAAPKI